jgi:putative tryptophan/tyrosine transport system substrate-binding protein
MQFGQLKRREFITLLGGAAATWPVAAHAQQAPRPVIGLLTTGWPGSTLAIATIAEVREVLAKAGYVEVSIEYRGAQGQYDRLPALARDLVARRVAVILAGASPSALAAQQATSTIPIVFFAVGGDPVKLGLVASFNRPGGNITGISILTTALEGKRLQLVCDCVPTAKTLGVVINPANPNAVVTEQELPSAAAALGRNLVFATARSLADFDDALASLVGRGAGALLVGSDPLFFSQGGPLVALAARHRLPAIYENRELVMAGGLMSYGVNVYEPSRQAATYAARILKGEKPADLPVTQPTRFDLVINLITARALGLNIPANILAQADEVIE